MNDTYSVKDLNIQIQISKDLSLNIHKFLESLFCRCFPNVVVILSIFYDY